MKHRTSAYVCCLGLTLALAGSGLALEPVESREPMIWLGPRAVDAQASGIGKSIPNIPFSHLHGGEDSLYRVTGATGTVVFVRDPECPVSLRYGPRSAALARWYREKGIGSVFIYLNNNLGAQALLRDAARLHTDGTLVARGSFLLADELQVVSTGDAFLLNADNELIYRGAIDDQYGFGYTRDAPTNNYLRNAMDALLQGASIEVPATIAPGCVIDADPAKDRLFPDIPFDAQVS